MKSKALYSASITVLLSALSIFLLLSPPFVFAQEQTPQPQEAKEEEVEKIEEKAAETKEVLEKKKEEAEKVKQEAEKLQVEKEVLEKEAQLKKQAAQVAKQEVEVLKKEAEITQDPEAKKRAKELTEEAKQLEEEAKVVKERLEVADRKAKIAEETVASHEARINALKQELQDLKKEKTARRTWFERFLIIAVSTLAAALLFFLMRLGITKFVSWITPKDVVRESGTILRIKTLVKVFHWLAAIIIFGIMAYIVLDNFGIDVTPLLAGAGIVGIAFGFGGQYLIRDIINGIFILFEGQYRVHDVVKIGEHGGLVEDINLRVTTLRDLKGRVIIIPNGEIKTVINFTKGFSYALLEIGVAYKENVDRVMETIKQVGREMREDRYFSRLILQDLEMLGVNDFAESQVTILFRIKTLPIKQWDVAREFRRRLKNRFDELGIEIPFPHMTFYWGTGKDNDWMRDFATRLSAPPRGPS